MIDVIKIDELEFVKLIEAEEIAKRIQVIASQINTAEAENNPLFLVVLNGAFVFAADLLREITIDCDIKFIDAKSYDGVKSTGVVSLNAEKITFVKDRNVIIVEDIVDSGNTVNVLNNLCSQHKANSVKVASFLSKPSEIQYDITVDYVGFEIAKLFVLGYGLDYNEKGRNLPHIYQIRPFI